MPHESRVTSSRQRVAALVAVVGGESLLDPAVTGTVLERIRRVANGTDPHIRLPIEGVTAGLIRGESA